MGFCAKFKCFFFTFLIVYATYLYSYKCENLEAPIENAVDHTVFEPLSDVHVQLCGGLHKGVDFVQPYVKQIQNSISSHDLYKTHAHAHVTTANNLYQTYAAPMVVKVYQAVEVYERIIVAHLLALWAKAQAFYAKEIAPKFA